MLLSKSSLRAAVLTTFAMISLCASAQRPTPGAAHAEHSPDATATQSALTLKSPDARAQKIRSSYSKFEFRIPMRDGKRLFTAVCVPNAASKAKRYPILMKRTPYSSAPYGVDRYRSALGPTEQYEKRGFIDVNPGKQRGWIDNDADAGKRDYGGQQTLVRGEPFRMRFRESYETPKALTQNEVTSVKFARNVVLHTFKRGHWIMLQVKSSWFAFVDRNPQRYVPNIFAATAADYVKANHRVHRPSTHPSSIRVQVFCRAWTPTSVCADYAEAWA
ncbi:MAG: CocE/NonD family hydrolase C-terminal non-catalytic domain-containing protein [Pseudomonadota bacterium]|nr:CocE/NonD family hydrolase C-terminal non-catalytic domain-containing protein [Pseudomonadota bacterium]